MNKVKVYEFSRPFDGLVVIDHGEGVLTVLHNGSDLGTGQDFEVLGPKALLEYRIMESLEAFAVVDGFSVN